MRRNLRLRRTGSGVCTADRERLFTGLVHESLRDPAAWEQPLALPVSLSQGQMAAMVCSTQPTVSETLHQLQDEGLIDIRGRGIVIRRPQALLAALESPADRP